jgi:peptidoglycan/LPS O-acetylase OafA/YrhL
VTISYRPDIDGLRALAVLSVIGFHALPEVFPGGFIGVDIFFVISGYLISSILLAESSKQGAIDFLAFYARRILRIFPALIVVLMACLFAGWHTLLAEEYKALGKHMAAGAAFVANFSFWFEAGYFDRASEAKPLLHLWSLGIEEQFYIVWPVLLWLVLKVRRVTLRLVIALAIASLLFASVLVFQDRTQAFYSPLTRAWELLAGALLAFAMQDARSLAMLPRHWLMPALGLLLAAVGIVFIQSRFPFPGLLALVPVISAVLLIGGSQGSWVNQRILANPLMVKIGLISYPLYLWHWPLLSFAFIIESGRPAIGIRLAIVALSFLLATLTFHWIEKPIKRLPRKFSIALLVCLMLVLGLLGKNIYDRNGLERIRHKRIIALSESANQDFIDFEKRGLITDEKCERPFKFPGSDVCLIAHRDRAPTAAVIGDSHALHAYWGLSQAFDRQGENLVLLGRGACIPFMDFTLDGNANQCQPHINEALSYVAGNPEITKVVLVYRGRYVSATTSPQVLDSFKAGLDHTLQKLTLAGKRVYYFLPIVEPGFDPRLCMGNLPLGRKPPFPCDIQRAQDDKKTAFLRAMVSEVSAKYPQVKLVDPNASICQNGICPMILDGHSVFKDDNHLSYFGSQAIGRSFDFSQ